MSFPVGTGFFWIGGKPYARLLGGDWLAIDEHGHLRRVHGQDISELMALLSKDGRFLFQRDFMRHLAPDARVPD